MRSGFHFLHGQTKRRFRLGVLFVAAGFSLLHVTQHVFTNQGYTNDSNRNRLPDMDWYRSGRDGLVGHSFLSRAGYVLASFLYLHPGDFRSRTENGMRVWKTGRRTAVRKTRLRHGCRRRVCKSFPNTPKSGMLTPLPQRQPDGDASAFLPPPCFRFPLRPIPGLS